MPTKKQLGASSAVVCAAAIILSQFLGIKEGNSLKAYLDAANIWTACRGVAYVPAHSVYTPAQCKAMNESAEGRTLSAIAPLVPSDITPLTFAADGSFAYNIGIGGFKGSSALRLQQQGMMKEGCEAMLKWYKSDGRDCRLEKGMKHGCYGVWTRRQDERNMCLEGLK